MLFTQCMGNGKKLAAVVGVSVVLGAIVALIAWRLRTRTSGLWFAISKPRQGSEDLQMCVNDKDARDDFIIKQGWVAGETYEGDYEKMKGQCMAENQFTGYVCNDDKVCKQELGTLLHEVDESGNVSDNNRLSITRDECMEKCRQLGYTGSDPYSNGCPTSTDCYFDGPGDAGTIYNDPDLPCNRKCHPKGYYRATDCTTLTDDCKPEDVGVTCFLTTSECEAVEVEGLDPLTCERKKFSPTDDVMFPTPHWADIEGVVSTMDACCNQCPNCSACEPTNAMRAQLNDSLANPSYIDGDVYCTELTTAPNTRQDQCERAYINSAARNDLAQYCQYLHTLESRMRAESPTGLLTGLTWDQVVAYHDEVHARWNSLMNKVYTGSYMGYDYSVPPEHIFGGESSRPGAVIWHHIYAEQGGYTELDIALSIVRYANSYRSKHCDVNYKMPPPITE